jgi:hypothetical protein
LKQKTGTLTIQSLPETGAELFLDGKQTGQQTPFTFKIPVGDHTIVCKLQGYDEATEKFTVGDGENKNLTIKMNADFAELTITTDTNADIYIDNVKVGTSKYSARIAAGQHIFEARKANMDADI